MYGPSEFLMSFHFKKKIIHVSLLTISIVRYSISVKTNTWLYVGLNTASHPSSQSSNFLMWRKFWTGGSSTCTRRPNVSQICYIGFKSELMVGHGRAVTASPWRNAGTAVERYGLALSSINKGPAANWWLSKWDTTTGRRTTLMYWSHLIFLV